MTKGGVCQLGFRLLTRMTTMLMRPWKSTATSCFLRFHVYFILCELQASLKQKH